MTKSLDTTTNVARVLDDRAHDAARRIANGEPIQTIADHYGVTRVTIWRWHNQVLALDLPDPVDRVAFRAEIVPLLIDSLIKAQESENWRAVGLLTDRLAKLMGLDHSDALNEAMVRIREAQAMLAVEAVKAAMDTAGLTREQRVALIDGMKAHAARNRE